MVETKKTATQDIDADKVGLIKKRMQFQFGGKFASASAHSPFTSCHVWRFISTLMPLCVKRWKHLKSRKTSASFTQKRTRFNQTSWVYLTVLQISYRLNSLSGYGNDIYFVPAYLYVDRDAWLRAIGFANT